jgi:hypothetical protein
VDPRTIDSMVSAAGFTVVAAPPFAKQAPATGTTGLGSPVTLQWTAVSGDGYVVCWDNTNNSTCDTGWQENGGATTKALYGLPVGTYYWPFDLVDQWALRATLSEPLDCARGESKGGR